MGSLEEKSPQGFLSAKYLKLNYSNLTFLTLA